MQSWPTVFSYILYGWAVGFTSAAAFHFATWKMSIFKRVDFWTGSKPD